MIVDAAIKDFLSKYDQQVYEHALKIRKLLLESLPDITEQLDLPAKMIAYCYGQKYTELICVIIPSKKGLKLGFNRGNELPDPGHLLEGKGKISRYVQIGEEKQINYTAVKELILHALVAYKERKGTVQ